MKKVYNVDVYRISHASDLRMLYKLENRALVKKSIFGVKEIISGEPLKEIQYKTSGSDYIFTGSLDFFRYEKKGYVLGVLKEDLDEQHLANSVDLTEYLYTFKDTKLCALIERMKFKPIEDSQEKQKEKIRQKLNRVETRLINKL